MIVFDTSVFVDAIIPRVKSRHELAMDILSAVDARNLAVFEPKVFLVELAGVLARYKPRAKIERHVEEVARHVSVVNCGEIHDFAYEAALNTGCRAIDA